MGDGISAQPAPIGDDLAAVRRRHREVRLGLALRELRGQASRYRANDLRPPEGLVRAIRDFEHELAVVRSAPDEDPPALALTS